MLQKHKDKYFYDLTFSSTEIYCKHHNFSPNLMLAFCLSHSVNAWARSYQYCWAHERLSSSCNTRTFGVSMGISSCSWTLPLPLLVLFCFIHFTCFFTFSSIVLGFVQSWECFTTTLQSKVETCPKPNPTRCEENNVSKSTYSFIWLRTVCK